MEPGREVGGARNTFDYGRQFGPLSGLNRIEQEARGRSSREGEAGEGEDRTPLPSSRIFGAPPVQKEFYGRAASETVEEEGW